MVTFYCILNVAGINSCNIRNENNSSKIDRHDFLKKFCFELTHGQLEERAVCSTLPTDLRAEICKLPRTETSNLPLQEKLGRCRECRGKDWKTQYYCFCCYNFLEHAHFVCSECFQSSHDDMLYKKIRTYSIASEIKEKRLFCGMIISI